MGVTTSAHIGNKIARIRPLVQTANGGSIQRKIMEHVRAPTLTRKRADSVAASNASGEETTTQTGETATIFGLAIGLTHREEANTDVADGHCITPKLIISPNADPATHKIGDLYPKRFHRNIQSIPQNWKGTRPRGQPIPAHRY